MEGESLGGTNRRENRQLSHRRRGRTRERLLLDIIVSAGQKTKSKRASLRSFFC